MTNEPGTSTASTRHEPGANPAAGRQKAGVSLQEAALQLDVSERTVRRLIREGSVQAYKQKAARGFVWRVVLDHKPTPEPGTETRQDGAQVGTSPAHAEEATTAPHELMRALETALEMADRLQQEASERADKIAELTGTAAHWQARAVIAEEQARRAEEQIKLLTAPKEDPEPAEAPPAEPEQRRSWWRRLLGA